MNLHSVTHLMPDVPMPWLIVSVAVWTAAVVVILLALVTLVPPLWREGRALIHDWLAPEPEPDPRVVDLETRRRHLNAVVRTNGGR